MISLTTHTKNLVLEITSYLFVILFLYTAISKLLDFENFQLELQKSPLLSNYYKIISLAIPAAEIIISLLLLFKKTRFIALNAFLFLMTVFTTYILIILNFTGYIPCTCGGVIESLGWTEHLVFNSLFVLLAILDIFFYPSSLLNNKTQRNLIAQ